MKAKRHTEALRISVTMLDGTGGHVTRAIQACALDTQRPIGRLKVSVVAGSQCNGRLTGRPSTGIRKAAGDDRYRRNRAGNTDGQSLGRAQGGIPGIADLYRKVVPNRAGIPRIDRCARDHAAARQGKPRGKVPAVEGPRVRRRTPAGRQRCRIRAAGSGSRQRGRLYCQARCNRDRERLRTTVLRRTRVDD